MKLTIETAQRAQARRVAHLHAGHRDWTLAEWGNAMAGECGEACNVIKKIVRKQDGFDTDRDKSFDELRRELGVELADTLAYMCALADKAGIDLAAVFAHKFNLVSANRGVPIYISDDMLVDPHNRPLPGEGE